MLTVVQGGVFGHPQAPLSLCPLSLTVIAIRYHDSYNDCLKLLYSDFIERLLIYVILEPR